MFAKTLYLTFHGIGDPVVPPAEGELRYFVTADVFRRTIAMLDELEAKTGVEAFVTFDDGNASDYSVALPTLVDHRRRGIFFVLAGRIGRKGYLSAAQLREIAEAGMTIGSHGHDHVDWRRLDAVGRQREFVDARKAIEDVIGVPVNYASLPFGGFDRPVLTQLKAERYDRIFTSSTGLTYRNTWFNPRRSLTDAFDPATGLLSLGSTGQKARGLAYRIARRLRYRC